MFDPQTAAFLAGGCALVVGTVDTDGEPLATRGWGLDVDGESVRLLVTEDPAVLANLAPGAPVAVTAADVPTLRSLQLKGHVVRVAPGGPADAERARAYCDAFFGDIHRTDGTALTVLERIVPAGFAVCDVVVEELFDQTPGPGAGARLTP